MHAPFLQFEYIIITYLIDTAFIWKYLEKKLNLVDRLNLFVLEMILVMVSFTNSSNIEIHVYLIHFIFVHRFLPSTNVQT